MADSVLEHQRFAHEDLERLEQAIADRLTYESHSKRENLSQQHDAARFLDRIQEQSLHLLRLYQDANESRKTELANLQSADNDVNVFYNKLKSIRDFHRRYPNREVDDLSSAYRKRPHVEGEERSIDKVFTGEERYGRYMDLNQFHDMYVNLKGTKHISIAQYVDIIDKFDQISQKNKNEPYSQYLRSLLTYLESFYTRTRPLEEFARRSELLDTEFETLWRENRVDGWSTGGEQNGTETPAQELYCRVCDKIFSKETVYNAHLTGKKHIKAQEASEKSGADDAPKDGTHKAAANKSKAMTHREFRIKRLFELLARERKDTRDNLTRKQTLTATEWEAEIDAIEQAEIDADQDQEQAEDEQEQESDGKIYNPLKLPLGWDGKPIPFWLWKLHGLGVEYSCEVCGNYVYMGRKNFDKHFLEQRHVYGLRCLGIQPSPLFNQITSIQDAIDLWDKIKKDKKTAERQVDSTIEVEDEEGNVMSERVYNDLKAQGLI